jgi:tRNA A37 methylthiotransferase MiaB
MWPAIMATTAFPSAPKIGMVSLGCPKALVDSERILTKLRSDGYAMSADYAGADVVLVNTCGFLDSAKEESLEAIGEAIAENGRVIVTGCMGNEAELIRARFPSVLAITGAHQYEDVVNAVHEASGAQADATPLQLSQDFRGLQPSLLLLHHPLAARRPSQPAHRRGAARGGEAGFGGDEGIAGHQPGHICIWRRHPP